MTPPRPRLPRQAGFTLVEVLVAMVLLSVVMVALTAAMRSIGQAEQRVDERLQAAQDARATTHLLRLALQRASARRMPAPGADRPAGPYFVGQPAALEWVGVMPAGFGQGGRHFFRLALEPAVTVRGGADLVLRFLPWAETAGRPDWPRSDSRVIANEVTGFAVSYEGPEGDQAGWRSAWDVTVRLPARVALRWAVQGNPLPDLVVAMRAIGADAPGGGGGAVIGGGR